MRFLLRLLRAESVDQPGRMLTGIGAMLVSVCLIVWLVGSYDSMIRSFDEEADSYMGVYDLCIGPVSRGGMPGSNRSRAKGEDGDGLGFGFLGTGTGLKDKEAARKTGSGMPGQGRPERSGRSGGKPGRESAAFSSAPSLGRTLPDSLVAELKKEPSIETMHLACQVRVPIGKNDTRTGQTFDDFIRSRMGTPSPSPMLVASDASWCPFEMETGRWPDMAVSHAMEGVLGSGSAKMFDIHVGDMLSIRSGERVSHVKVVGIVEQPQGSVGVGTGSAGPALASFFIPRPVFKAITGEEWQPNLVYLRLRESVDKTAFMRKWQPVLESSGAAFADTEAVRRSMERNRSVSMMKSSANSAVGLVLFSCIFIIFTTLSMGVRERSRKLALMRALGVSKRQIAGLVFGESLMLSIPAMVGGLLAGWVLLAVMDTRHGWWASCPSWDAVLLALACALAGGLIAAVIPAWRSTRLSPMEMCESPFESAARSGRNFLPLLFVIGILAWSVQPVVLLIPGLGEEIVKPVFTLAGYPCLILGALCLAPAFAIVAERVLAPFTAYLLRLPGAFLRLQLTSNLAQSAGTVISMTVGLGLFMAIQMWGYSMLVPFTPDRTLPNTLVSVLHADFAPDECREVIREIGMDPDKVYPIYVEEPSIAEAQLASPAFAAVKQKTVVVAGVPLRDMMDGPDASLNLQFIQGGRDEALKKMESGRAVLIPNTFADTAHLKVGDMLMLDNPSSPGEIKPWEVAGVVAMPGWHWLTKTSGIRVRTGSFIAGLLIADEARVRETYGVERVRFFWGDAPEDMSAEMFRFALEGVLEKRNHGKAGEIVGRGVEIKPMVKVSSRETLTQSVGARADSVLDAMSRLPLIALAIAMLAVMNTVMASVRSRRHAIGVMRAVGVTRGMVVRMVWAESLLLGGAAILLSFAFASLVSWGALEIQRFGFVFGTIVPPLHIPWLHILFGSVMTLFLCLLAGTVAAVRIVRRPPDQLMKDIPG